ncbi:MAG: urea transporter [Alistipes sp.]|nr:urea transporter [Alistipes sp.]
MNTTTITDLTRRPSFDFLRIVLRGTGQVMFQNNAWTGLLFLCGIFWGAYAGHLGAVAWGALLGVVVSTLTGRLLRLPERDGVQGLWGFNGVLVGCAFPTFLGNTWWMWLSLILCAALTTWVRTGFNNMMAPWKVNSLTFPFVFCTWIFLLAARAMHGLPTTHMSAPELPSTFSSMADLGFGHLIAYWLRGIAQVFLIDSWVTGLFFLAGLAASSLRAALWAAVGSALALLTAIALEASGSQIAGGLYGYSPVLTAIALATVFYRPNRYSAAWAVVGTLVTVFVQAGMYVLLAPLGIATLTAPFCVTTWLFLLPRIRFDENEHPDHSNWDVENKTHLASPRK